MKEKEKERKKKTFSYIVASLLFANRKKKSFISSP